MKCHVCGSRVPLGAKECPNCGCTLKAKKEIKLSHNQKAIVLAICIVICIFAYGIMNPKILSQRKPQTPYGQMSYATAIQNGYDDGTIEVAMDYQKKIETFVQSQFPFIDFHTSQHCYYVGNQISTIFSIEGTYQDSKYMLHYTFEKQKLQKSYFAIYGTCYESIQTLSKIPIDQEVTQKIGDYMGIENLYFLIKEACQSLQQDPNHQQYSSYLRQESPYIQIDQTKNNQTGYDFYINVSL